MIYHIDFSTETVKVRITKRVKEIAENSVN